MSSSAIEPEAPDLICQLDNVQGVVDALTAVRWKRHQDAVIEISEHGIVLIVEETSCLQAKVYLKSELFVKYEYGAEGRPRFGVSLGLFVDCLNTFSVPSRSSSIEIRYPGPDMQLLLTSIDSSYSCIYAEIRTRIPETVSWDYNFEPAENPLSFTVKIDMMYSSNTGLLLAFNCDRRVSHRYKYKFLRATTSNIPTSVIRENRGSKLSIGRGGMLKVQHLFSVARPFLPHPHVDTNSYQQPSRIAYIEFFVKPEIDEEAADD